MNDRLIAEIKARDIPPLYAQQNAKDPTIYLEIGLFGFPWRWFVSECSPEENSGDDIMFFGFVNGHFNEWGHSGFRKWRKLVARCW